MGVYAMTGGATGIGAAIKQQLKDAGHQVVVVDIKDAEIVTDLSTVEGREVAVAGILAVAPNGLDGFVPCAGLGPHVSPHSLITKVNYFAAVATTEGLIDALVKRGGAVVMISSNSASMPGYDERYVQLLLEGKETEACELIDSLDGQTAYGGSKLAIARWMRHQSTDYAKRGVRINAVAPGITKTPLTDKGLEDPTYGPLMKDFGATIPTGDTAQPEQIANAVNFLLSDKADFICGSVLFADGGHDAMFRPDQF